MQMDFVKHVVHIRRQTNWKGYYEIYNAGQLFWFAKQVNDSNIPNNEQSEADEGY